MWPRPRIVAVSCRSASAPPANEHRAVETPPNSVGCRLRARPSRRAGQRAAAYTLLEIILALTILAGAVATLGEIVRLGDRNAVSARDSTSGQFFAASLLAEILSGARAPVATQGVEEIAAGERWAYRIEINPTKYEELSILLVIVSQDLPDQLEPVSFTLIRWIPNPQLVTSRNDSTESTSTSSFDAGSSSESSR